jgi:peptidoglycan hydrolase-like protein with peptidoglycan-binding domain
MLIVHRGDHSPSVVLLQVLLNRRGAGLKVDGFFGPKTETAVQDFQSTFRMTFSPPGVAGEGLWNELFRGTSLRVVDAYDLGEPRSETGARIAEQAGSVTLRTGAMCNGVDSVVQRAIGQTGGPGTAALMRIWGHGNLGRWLTFSVGEVVDLAQEDPAAYAAVRQEWRSYLDPSHFDAMASVLRPLASVFAPFGSFEAHGCSLGSVPRTRQLLGRIANLLGVPVTVGIGLQPIPRQAATAFRFSGRTFTAYPHHGDLRSWAHAASSGEVGV